MTEPELRAYFAALARFIEGQLPPGPSRQGRALFTLLVWEGPGLGQYVSNCDRSTMVRALRETADRLERREDDPR